MVKELRKGHEIEIDMTKKEPGVLEGKDTSLLTDKKTDVNDENPDSIDKNPEIDALKGTINALKDTVGIQMVAAEDLRETIKDLRECNAKLEAELQKK